MGEFGVVNLWRAVISFHSTQANSPPINFFYFFNVLSLCVLLVEFIAKKGYKFSSSTSNNTLHNSFL